MYILGSVFANVSRCNGGQSHIVMHCNTLRHTATNVYGCNCGQDHTATHCKTLHDTAWHCKTLQHTARHGKTLQHSATHCHAWLWHYCNTLPHTATHCNKREQIQWWTRWQFSQRSTSLMMSLLSTSTWRISCTLSWPPRSSLCCSVLQYVAVCCTVLHCLEHHLATDLMHFVLASKVFCCSVLHCGLVVCRSVMRCVALICSVLQCVAVCCSVLQCVFVFKIVLISKKNHVLRVLQCVAVCCTPRSCWQASKQMPALQCVAV